MGSPPLAPPVLGLLCLLTAACEGTEERVIVAVEGMGGGAGAPSVGGSAGTVAFGSTGGTGGQTITGLDCFDIEIAYLDESNDAAGCDPGSADSLDCGLWIPYQLGCDCVQPVNPANTPELTILGVLEQKFHELGCQSSFSCTNCVAASSQGSFCAWLPDGQTIGAGYSGVCDWGSGI